MKVAIIKYPGGNIQSVSFALKRMGINPLVSDAADEISSADRVIFPGVGEARTAMHYLRKRGLDQVIRNLKQPVLGICLGMQLMCRHSQERDTPGLGIFDANVVRFTGDQVKVPHMGWNRLGEQRDWLQGLPPGVFVYFVHSYYVPVNSATVAEASYGVHFSAALRKDNFYAVQFHPEKSGHAGALILEVFLTEQ